MTNEFKPSNTKWKLWRSTAAMTDDDWADDVSDALPTTGLLEVPKYAGSQRNRVIAVEFMALPYDDAGGLLVDPGTDTFSADITFIIDADLQPSGSAITGRTATEDKVAVRQTTAAGLLFNVVYRFDCDGDDKVAIRLHTLSGTPTGADDYEIWARYVYG